MKTPHSARKKKGSKVELRGRRAKIKATPRLKVLARVEENLLRERKLSESIINSLPGIFYLFDQNGKYLRWNRNLEKVTGYSGTEIAAMHPLDFFAKEEKALVAARIKTVFSKGQSEVEADIVAKDGGRTPYYFTGSLMQFHDRPCVIGMGINIAERKWVERRDAVLSKLGQSLGSATTAEEAARVIGAVADELFGWDACAVNLYPEGRVYPILNMDLIGGKRVKVPQDDILARPSARAQRIMQQGAELFLVDNPSRPAPGTNAFGDKSRPSASSMMAPIRNRTIPVGILSFQSYTSRAYDERDLHTLQTLADHCSGALERIRVEQELKGSELRFHSVWENSADGMRLTDENGRIVAVNDAFCKLIGAREGDLVGRPFTVMYADSENPELLLQKYRQRFRNRTVEQLVERKLAFRNGKLVDLEVTNSYIELPENRHLVLGLFRDITEHKRAEEELRESEAQLRLVWENSLDGMRLLDEEGKFLMVNEAYCRLVGKSWEELKGQPFWVVYDSKNREDFITKYKERVRTRTIKPHLEKTITLWNGTTIHLELTNSLLEVGGQPARLVSTFRDLTVSKRVQRQIQLLEQQQVLEKERDRIARDMHDDVGGSLTRITLLGEIVEAEIASGKIVAPEDSRLRLQNISTMSRELVRNIDEIVWAVDPGNDTLEKFASYICHMSEEVLKVAPINCRLDVPAILPNYFLPSDVRHNLFLVVKEALNNAIKHAAASEVSLHMNIAASEFTISIADDGRGLAAGEVKPFSNGLNNMRRRMDKIGGEFGLESRPGRGTAITLKINLKP